MQNGMLGINNKYIHILKDTILSIVVSVGLLIIYSLGSTSLGQLLQFQCTKYSQA